MKPLMLTLFLSLTCIFSAFADTASYDFQLIKLSKSLRGQAPSVQERRDLEIAVKQGTAEQFLKNKTKEYTQSEAFTLKLKQKVDELMRFNPQTSTDTGFAFGISYDDLKTAYDYFVRDLISANKPWDSLLTGKEYSFQPVVTNFGQNEQDFFNNLISNGTTDTFENILNPVDNPSFKFSFDPADPRVAGVITTTRFFRRYVNTALNKNRRRAAAVFKIFLCDTMIPTVPVQDATTEKKDYDTIFPDHANWTEDQIRLSFAGTIHGDQPDCKSCHYKLDPLGQVFGLSASTLSPIPSPGALRYQGYDGRKVDISVDGFGGLATALVQQPEYLKCQISHFWRWYIGKDVPLTQTREAQLISEFNRVGRKPQDFVSFLVSQPEFKQKPQVLTEDQILPRRVAKIFKNCNSCHDSQGEEVWDLTDFPYGKTPTERLSQLKKLKKILDLDNNGMNAKMPPRDSLWKLNQDDILLLKKWMNKGAPDFQGTPQVPGGTL